MLFIGDVTWENNIIKTCIANIVEQIGKYGHFTT